MLDPSVALAAAQVSLGLDSQTIAASESVSQHLGTSEWLGPLAPVALSPFFGLTILSGIATYGPDWLQQRSALVGDASLLNNALLFWAMLALSLLTSLPRLTKVSKPLALAAENLETYSAVIILVAVRLLGSPVTTSLPSDEHLVSSLYLVQAAGIGSVSLDIVMSIAAAINVVVINGVKLVFEFAVWLIPFPAIDALVESLNKLLCATLMAIYCFSPAIATVINLVMLVVCASVFEWSFRRVRYYRQIITGPMLAWLAPKWFAQRGQQVWAFCERPTVGMPRYARVRVERLADNQYRVHGRWLWRRMALVIPNCQATSEVGMFVDKLQLVDKQGGTTYVFLHRKWVATDESYVPTDRYQVASR